MNDDSLFNDRVKDFGFNLFVFNDEYEDGYMGFFYEWYALKSLELEFRASDPLTARLYCQYLMDLLAFDLKSLGMLMNHIILSKDILNIESLGVELIINGKAIEKYKFKEEEPVKMEKEGLHEFDLVCEETGEFLCDVKVNDDILDSIIEHGFRSILTDMMVKKDPMYKIDRVIFNDPATIILWSNGDKTVAKTMKNDIYQPEVGFAMAYMKKLFGSRSSFDRFINKWLPAGKEVSKTEEFKQLQLEISPRDMDYMESNSNKEIEPLKVDVNRHATNTMMKHMGIYDPEELEKLQFEQKKAHGYDA